MNQPDAIILNINKKCRGTKKIAPYYTEYPSKDNIDRSFALFMPYFTIIHCGIATRHKAITPTTTSFKTAVRAIQGKEPHIQPGKFYKRYIRI